VCHVCEFKFASNTFCFAQIFSGCGSVTIHHFQHLEHIVMFKPTEQELLIILKVYGSKLKHLEIIAAPFGIDFGALVMFCPRLVTLSLHLCSIQQSVFNLANGTVVSALRSIEIINSKR
jgi:hypothetical protein